MSAQPLFDRPASSTSFKRWPLEPGQIAMHDVAANTSIVAVAGDIDLTFRDHSLAWLGADAPVVRVTVREGERYRIEQRGAIWLAASARTNVGRCIVHMESAHVAARFMTRFQAWLTDLRDHLRNATRNGTQS
jgi:hypothetical protein